MAVGTAVSTHPTRYRAHPQSGGILYGFPGAKLAGVRALIHSEHGRTFPESGIGCGCTVFPVYHCCLCRVRTARARSRTRWVCPHQEIEVLYNGVDFSRCAFDRPKCTPTPERGRRRHRASVAWALVPVKNYPPAIACYPGLSRRTRSSSSPGDGPKAQRRR